MSLFPARSDSNSSSLFSRSSNSGVSSKKPSFFTPKSSNSSFAATNQESSEKNSIFAVKSKKSSNLKFWGDPFPQPKSNDQAKESKPNIFVQGPDKTTNPFAKVSNRAKPFDGKQMDSASSPRLDQEEKQSDRQKKSPLVNLFRQDKENVQEFAKDAEAKIAQKQGFLRPVDQVLEEFKAKLRNIENKVTQQIIKIYDEINLSQKQEALDQMKQELMDFKAIYENGKEKWKQTTLRSMSESIMNEIEPIKKIVNLDENIMLHSLQKNLGIPCESIEEEKRVQSQSQESKSSVCLSPIAEESEVKEENSEKNLLVQFKPNLMLGRANDSLEKLELCVVYFSGYWCSEALELTPLLTKCYQEWTRKGEKIEVIFASLDNSLEEFNQYYSSMPWSAYPFQDKGILALKQKLEIAQNSAIAVFKKGKLMTKNGRADLMLLKEKAIEKWK